MSSPTTRVPRAALIPPSAVGAGLTNRGLVRERNEDSILTDPTGALWAVADGMGGYGHGDVASDIVIDRLAAIQDIASPSSALLDGLRQANRIIFERSQNQGRMGATVVAAIISQAVATIAWAGDSRVYLLRDGRLRQLTHDHTVVQDMVDRGEMLAQDAEHHPESHIITRAVGAAQDIEIDLLDVPLTPGDRLLLCSDGLPRCVEEGTIESLLGRAETAEQACQLLVGEALRNGAPDNVSAIAVLIEEG